MSIANFCFLRWRPLRTLWQSSAAGPSWSEGLRRKRDSASSDLDEEVEDCRTREDQVDRWKRNLKELGSQLLQVSIKRLIYFKISFGDSP